jgi:opacity protein-like surface antigen
MLAVAACRQSVLYRNAFTEDSMNKKLMTNGCVAAAAAMLLLAVAPVQAQTAATTGGYLFAAAGRSDFNNDCTGVSNCKNSGNAFKLGFGYRTAMGLAGEALVMDFGKSTGTSSGVDVSIKARAVGGGVALHAPLGTSFSAVVRLGVASVKMTGEGRLGSFVVSDSESSVQAYAGIGVAYAFTPNLRLEAAFDSTRGKLDGETGNVSAFTVGLGFSF